MVFILGIDIPIIAFFSIVAIIVTATLLIALIIMLFKGGKLIREAEDVIDEEEKIHHIHLHAKKISKPVVKKGPSFFEKWNNFWAEQKKVYESSWEERHDKELAEKKKQLKLNKKEEREEIALEKEEEKAAKHGFSFITFWNKLWKAQPKKESWWTTHKKIKAEKEEKPSKVEAPKPKKGPTLYQRWDSYWKKQKNELLNQPKWEAHKKEAAQWKSVIVKKEAPVSKGIQIKQEKQPKKKMNLFEAWNKYWKKQKKDLDEGMKPENDENEEG